jgi:hypothetical protein
MTTNAANELGAALEATGRILQKNPAGVTTAQLAELRELITAYMLTLAIEEKISDRTKEKKPG